MKLTNDSSVNLSNAKKVFCDSVDALNWAYKNGLSIETQVKSSAPALLWKSSQSISNVEEKWNLNFFKEFQSSIGSLSKNVFDAIISIDGVSHEEALCVTMTIVKFQILLYKASCLTNEDLMNPIVFIKVDGFGGPNGNNMNPPWEKILGDYKEFKVISFKQKSEWSILNTRKVSLYKRLKVAGLETILYRILLRIFRFLPKSFFTKKVFIYRENELVIETATSLALRGVGISSMSPEGISSKEISNFFNIIKEKVSPLLEKRISDYVIPKLSTKCKEIFFDELNAQLNLFYKHRSTWKSSIDNIKKEKGVVLTNHPSGLQGYAITSLCRERNIPVITAQHGVTQEISKYYDEAEYGSDQNTCDCYLAYNKTSAKIAENSHFSIGRVFVSGISLRHVRMASKRLKGRDILPLVYISTNIYKGNLGAFVGSIRDFDRSINEKNLITKVLSKLPYKVRYKTYPEDNRRYSDIDPVFNLIESFSNLELFSEKIDMRYLYDSHQIVMTSRATSTLGWAVMSNKPVVFINWRENNPLTKEAEESFKKGMFLFNDDDKDFHKKLLLFLSKPYLEIEREWMLKLGDRKKMVDAFFSTSRPKAGMQSAKLIINEYL